MAENYRNVSCKLLEHIICKHLLDHLEKNTILTYLNHGFRPRNTASKTMHDLLRNNDKGLQTDMVILDFAKAFDTVPHGKLLYKLENLGITGPIHSWLEMFLTQRHMHIAMEQFSDSVTVDSGVPQARLGGRNHPWF